MPLSSLILSADSQEVSVVECVLSSLRIDVEVESDAPIAWARISKSKVDAVIVDCDLAGTDDFLRKLKKVADQRAKPVVIVTGLGDPSRLQAAGGEFVAQKPISVEQAVHTFSAARNLILKARLHYYRQNLDTPVSITDTNEQIHANLLNLSQGGIRVQLQQQHALHGDVAVHFLLPGTEFALDARGHVAWADAQGNAGIRLMDLSEPAKRDLRLWLERQYFQTCGG